MKKQLKETIEDKKLIAINTYINLFLGKLEEVVDRDTGNIYLRESGDIYAKVFIQKKFRKCWVDYNFWREFSDLFSLQHDDIQSIITEWVEDTFQLKGIHIVIATDTFLYKLMIPTN